MPATGSALRKKLNAETTDESSEALKPATSFPGFKPFELKYDKLVIAVGCVPTLSHLVLHRAHDR